jgi:post-segregation antitoxin (ccd killing protein)
MATTKLSITVDTKRLEEIKKLSNAGVSLSAIIDEALQRELTRLQLIALLEEMERRNPISEKGRAEGERLWKRLKSSWTPAPSQRSRKKSKPSATRSPKP